MKPITIGPLAGIDNASERDDALQVGGHMWAAGHAMHGDLDALRCVSSGQRGLLWGLAGHQASDEAAFLECQDHARSGLQKAVGTT